MDYFLEKYVLAMIVMIILVLSLISTFVSLLLTPREKRNELPIATVFKKVVSDPPSLLALLLMLLVIGLVLVKERIPTIIHDSFFLAVGFYFGQKRNYEKLPT